MRPRIVVAFLVAPLVPSLVAATAIPFVGVDASLFGSYVMLALYGYAASVLLGIPTFLYFRRRGWVRWWQIALGAAAIGAIIPLLVVGVPFAVWRADLNTASISLVLEMPDLLARGSAIGALCGIGFWLVARRDLHVP